LVPNALSPDARYLIYEDGRAKTGQDLWLVALTGDRKPEPYLQTPFNEMRAQISPDNRWVAYTSDESGRPEVYIRPFPNASGGKWQVSTVSGDYVHWRNDGKELFFMALDRKLMAATVGGNRAPEIAVPRLLFETPSRRSAGTGTSPPYVVSRDGQRFLIMSLPTDSVSADPITVVLNWAAGLSRARK
jgi:protease II